MDKILAASTKEIIVDLISSHLKMLSYTNKTYEHIVV